MSDSAPPADQPLVRLRGVSVGYGERTVVRGVDLDVAAGERVAVLGSNGSGKTTLLRGLLGLAAVTGGTVEMFGRPAPSRTSRRCTGYVPQALTVGGGVPATVREVVAAGRLPLRPWWRPAGSADRSAVDRALAEVGMAEHADESLAELSGGQQRRVLIARALAAEPGLLVLDEPLAGVDAASSAALARTLARLASSGVTMLVVTHELDALADVVDRAVVVEHGRIAYDGPLADSPGPTGRLGGEAHPVHCHPRPAEGTDEPGSGWVDSPRTAAVLAGRGSHPDDHPEAHPAGARAARASRGGAA